MKIAEIHCYAIDLPVQGEAYVMGSTTVERLDSTIVEIVSNTGLRAYGEVCPVGPVYQPQHALGARAALAELAPALIGRDARNHNVLHQIMETRLAGHNYAKAAIDIALWDLAGKRLDLRVCDLLGGPLVEHVPSYYATRVGSPDETARLARSKAEQGFARIQVKVGGRDIDEDIETLHKVRAAVGRGVRLTADANRSWTVRDALLFSSACRDIPLIIEQPCNSIAEIRSLRGRLHHPLYLDESTTDLQIVIDALGERLCDGFSLKLTRLGGLSAMRCVRDLCRASAVPHTSDDCWGGDIIAAACVHLGSTIAPPLNEGTWIAEPYIDGHYDPENPITITAGQIDVPRLSGLGVQPDRQCLGEPVASYA